VRVPVRGWAESEVIPRLSPGPPGGQAG